MKPWIKSKLSIGSLIVLVVLSVFFLIIVERTKEDQVHPAYADQVQAAELMESYFRLLRQAREELNLPIDPELDPNQTGLIGDLFTEITTTVGNLEAKRTSTNPEFAALLVRYFHELKLQAGDSIAIGASGSFPGLILASLAASDVLGLQPLVIYSIGSSMYGANLPEFTVVKMLDVLQEAGIMPYNLLAISLGGDEDLAKGPFLDGAKEAFTAIVQASQVPFIQAPDIASSIQARLDLYQQVSSQRISCFINIGGASPNYGTTIASLSFPNGLVHQAPFAREHSELGLIYEFSQQGIPVIHFLDIRDLALKSGITIDPIPFPKVGVAAVYFHVVYKKWLIFVILLFLGLTLLSFVARCNGKRLIELKTLTFFHKN